MELLKKWTAVSFIFFVEEMIFSDLKRKSEKSLKVRQTYAQWTTLREAH